MTTKREQITRVVTKLLQENPNGMRYAELRRAVIEAMPKVKRGTIQGTLRIINQINSDISKPERGLYVLTSNQQNSDPIYEPIEPKLKEQDFYESFAEWLVDDLNECTEACAVGGRFFGGKWGTPDVIGTYKAGRRDVIQFTTEIISAEVKLASESTITAFGQAVAYRLFSNKVYLVLPNTITSIDLSRIESLAMLFGIGLVLFDPDKENPNYSIRVRAQRFQPDMFYANQTAEDIEKMSKKIFQRLF